MKEKAVGKTEALTNKVQQRENRKVSEGCYFVSCRQCGLMGNLTYRSPRGNEPSGPGTRSLEPASNTPT